MFDLPHLIKCIRNNLMKYTFKFGQYTATWQDILNFYNKDKELQIKAAPKLTDKHIRPKNFAKIKVKYATQILSHTVAASICMHVIVGSLPSSAMGINGHSSRALKCALNQTFPHLKFFVTFIKSLKIVNGNEVTGRIKCINGWLITINAICQIWNHLKQNHGFKFLLTRRLNTNPI